ncbi:MAG: site-specific integrase [Planctomycetes bacterium]|nr:site-specific integrase [Planctomycetota bacterium]
MKKTPAAAAPWEITDDMFLNEDESTRLLADLAQRETEADSESRSTAAVDRLIVELLLYSGLRNSELCRLRVMDTIIGHGESALKVCGTPKQDRTVYVPQATSRLIQRFVDQVRPDCLPAGSDAGDLRLPLILNERGNAYDRTALYRRVVRILTQAGLGERASVQLLRHTHGFLAYKRTGGNLLFVQRQLGHAHPMVTAVYAQFVNHPPAELAELAGGAVRSEPQKAVRQLSTRSRKKGSQ